MCTACVRLVLAADIMDKYRHGEEPNLLSPEVLNLDEKEEDVVTFRKNSEPVVNDISETESERATSDHENIYRSSDTSSRPPGDEFDYVGSSKEVSHASLPINEAELQDRNKAPSFLTKKRVREYNLLSLSHFLSDEVIGRIPPPDAMLNVEDNYFVVLHNDGRPGHTLFQCISQVVTGRESEYRRIRENLVDYICSHEGWDVLGVHVLSTYEHVITEFQSPSGSDRLGHKDSENFQKRLYRHYFMDEEIEGSLVELVAAAYLYGFNYTYMLLRETEGEMGKAECRICPSSISRTEVSSNAESKSTKEKQADKVNYFLRTGDSPEDWRWTLVVPYHNDGGNKTFTETSQVMRKGTYEAQLWNAYGLNWKQGIFSVHRYRDCRFCWNNGTSVITTSSGKLLGGYATDGKDLYSNLCAQLPDCVHVGDHCLLKDAVKYCSRKFSKFHENIAESFVECIIQNKKKSLQKQNRLELEEEVNMVGTLHDLHKASKIFNFGYYVIGIDENGEFHTLGRLEKDKIVYLLAKTNGNIVTEWLSLGDMRVFKTDSHESNNVQLVEECTNTESRLELLINHSKCPSDHGVIISKDKKRKDSSNGSYKLTSFRDLASRQFTRLRRFISRLNGRNKVDQQSYPHHVKIFPSSSDIDDR